MSRHFVFALAALLATTGCAPGDGPVSANAEPAEQPGPGSEIAATIGDQQITFDELDAFVKDELFASETSNGDAGKLYELRASAIERLVDKTIIEAAAATKEMSATEYLEDSVVSNNDVSDEEVRAYFDANQDKMGTAAFEEISERIHAYLRSQRAAQLVVELRAQSGARVLLEPPRMEVAATGPARGPEGAPVTIIEFSDFQCPYCKRVVPTLNQLVEAYPDQVRIVFRHLPLDRIHDRARAAAEASACADKQGKFWAYHDLIFENNGSLSDADLEKYAADVSIDVDAFRLCVASREFQAVVENDAKAAAELGLHGTPAFFINGIPVRGAKPLAEFVTIIDRELSGLPDASTPSG